jgi:N-methylhydantoinase A
LTLRADRAHNAVTRVADRAGLDVRRCAEGIVEVATASMVRALRRVSVERGIDPRSLVLVAFGGAGPLFACRMADALGVARALVPPHAGVLSALGLAAAPAKLEAAASLHRLARALESGSLEAAFAPLERQLRTELPDAVLTRHADCRYPGQGYELAVEASSPAATASAFHDAHEQRYGYADRGRDVEVVNVRVTGLVRGAALRLAQRPTGARRVAGAPRYAEAELPAGAVLRGPCAVDAVDCTTRVEPGWTAEVHPSGALLLERT